MQIRWHNHFTRLLYTMHLSLSYQPTWPFLLPLRPVLFFSISLFLAPSSSYLSTHRVMMALYLFIWSRFEMIKIHFFQVTLEKNFKWGFDSRDCMSNQEVGQEVGDGRWGSVTPSLHKQQSSSNSQMDEDSSKPAGRFGAILFQTCWQK